MNAGSHRAKVRRLLIRRNLDELLEWAGNSRNPQRVLLSLSFDHEELIRWRAIEAVGKVAGLQTKSGVRKVRELVRRLFWLMNDESGGLGWHSPELIGEILVNVPNLISEYAGLLPAYLREEPFERGTHIAVCRVSLVDSKPFAGCAPALAKSLNDPDPAIRGYAALTLGNIGSQPYRDSIEGLAGDSEDVTVYDFNTGQMRHATVAEMAKEAVGKQRAAPRVGLPTTTPIDIPVDRTG